MNKSFYYILGAALVLAGCNGKSNSSSIPSRETDAKYVGKDVGNFTAAEWYPGGQLGTTLNVADDSYEDSFDYDGDSEE